MISDLRAVMRDKTYAEITFIDGDSVLGFVTYVGADRFHIITMEAIMPKVSEENQFFDEHGNMLVQVDPSEVNFIPTKRSYTTDLVSAIAFDVSHRVEPEMLKSLFFLRDNTIYAKTEKKTTKRKTQPKIVKAKA